MATVVKKPLKDGSITYRIVAKVKNPRTDEFEAKSMTWHQPKEMTEQEAIKQVKLIAAQFEKDERHKQSSFQINDNSVTLNDYTQRWLERVKEIKSYNYYKKAIPLVESINQFFGNIKLREITPVMVQNFMDKISTHIVERKSSRMKVSIKTVLLSRIMKLSDLERVSGVKRCVYESAASGHTIKYENAVAICNGLKIDYDKYFETIILEKPYSKESIAKYKVVLSSIMSSAKRLGLIEHNYASRDYLEPIKGYKTEIPILNDTEAKILMKALEEEPNIRWKTSIMIVLLMGIRRGELAGLEWKDIDFENKTMTISRTGYKIDGGLESTKLPKTQTSIRTITMPKKLIEQLIVYKQWWDERKAILVDVWKGKDRLMLSDDGRIITPSMYVKWLHAILDRAGLPRVTLHSIRHTNITLQLIAGVDIKTVATRAGHARASTTSDFYSHFIKSSDINASATINNIFKKKTDVNEG